MHPQIDVRAAGDLLQRVGFALPVADSVALDVRYPDLLRLARDLRGMAAGNLLVGAGRVPILRQRLAAMMAHFAEGADPDGRVAERFEIVFMTGWAPGPDQPKPAARGSGTASLAAALRPN